MKPKTQSGFLSNIKKKNEALILQAAIDTGKGERENELP